MEITKSNKRLLASLATVKGRREHSMYLAEGTRCVLETLPAARVHNILCTQGWLEMYHDKLPSQAVDKICVVKRGDLAEISSLSTPADVIAVYHIVRTPFHRPVAGELALALDRIQDPGNIGTIVRTASWQGINHIYCSHDTVDIHNPKVVQSTMGAVAKVNIHYCDLKQLLHEARLDGIAVYGTFLDGKNMYDTPLTPGGIIVMGNEGNGISNDVASEIDHRLYIPPYPADADCVESLNVAIATAVTVAEFRRRLVSCPHAL